MKPILYSYWRSSCSYRVRIALNIKDIDYEYRAIHLVQNGGEQFTSDYTQLNPKAEVPFFKDQNIELSQSMAIIQYVDQAYEGDQLFSQNLTEKAVQIQMCEIVNSGIQPLQNLNVMKKIQKDFKLSDPDKMEWSRFWIAN
jgi:maleylacetoacetate isomerase